MTAGLMIRYRVRVCPLGADESDGDCYLERIASAANEMGGMDGLLFPIGAVAATDDWWPGSPESTTSRSCVLPPAFDRI
jgi:hypothetical protein